MSFFANTLGGNPFSTPVGGKIELATDGSLASENWALNMEICDMVNETEEGPRDAIKAIRKRLTQNAGKNYTVVMYTLTVLETCVKNCGRKFHVLVCSKDFVQELVKLIGPKNDPPTAVQEKVLSLIQSWADAFRNQPDFAGVVSVYSDLRAKGIEFPPTDLDAMAPIHTPQRSVESSVPTAPEPRPHHHPPTTTTPPPPTQPTTATAPLGVTTLTAEQRAKLRSELDVVESNMSVLGELLSEADRPPASASDTSASALDASDSELELLRELRGACGRMQERLVELIGRLAADDEVTAELLRVNDDMNNLFLRYGRWEKNREARGAGEGGEGGEMGRRSAAEALAEVMGRPAARAQVPSDDSLIDLGPPDDDDVAQQLSKLGISDSSASAQLAKIETVTARNGPQGDAGDDFDMFAQSRKATYESSKTEGSSYKDNINPDQVQGGLSTVAARQRKDNVPDLEFDEMEAWLGDTSGTEETVTSTEFERFLAERAAAAESLPPLTPTTVATTNQKAP